MQERNWFTNLADQNNKDMRSIMTTFLLMTLCMLPLAADIHAAEQGPVADGPALRTASLFCDNMVFQQNTSAAIWGWGEPGDTVSVTTSWDGRRYTAGIPTGGGAINGL